MTFAELPGPSGLPVIGQARQMRADILGFHERLQADYGDVAHYHVMGTDFCSVTDPGAIRQILIGESDDYEKGTLARKQIGGFLGEGIFFAEGEQWRRQRKHIQPVFFRERLDTYVPTIWNEAELLTDRWREREAVNLEVAMVETTLRILGRTLFGISVEDEPVLREVTPAILARFDTTKAHAYVPDSAPIPAIRRYRQGIDRLHAFIKDLMATQRDISPGERGQDLLSIFVGLVEADVLSEIEARDNLVTFLFAGHETSAHGLTFTLCELARNQEEQDAIHEELATVLTGEAPTAVELGKLERVERAIDEGLRLYPPAYLTFREPIRDVELGGYTIPAGTTLSIPQWVVHRDSRWWDNPETYRPARFTETLSDRPEYAYFPFGGGPRHCIAMRFALMEMKIVIATILSRYELAFVGRSDFSVEAASNLRLKAPAFLTARERGT